MHALYHVSVLVGGALLLWCGLGAVVITLRSRTWPILLWSVVLCISGLRLLAQAIDLWMQDTVVWYILSAITLMAFLTFTLKYRGWRLLQDHRIGGKQLLVFWKNDRG